MTKDRRGTWAINQMPITSRRASSTFAALARKPAKHSHLGRRLGEAMPLPIENLIEVGEMGLRRSELISRLGYKNISRGLRSLARLSAGDLDGY
jgi:hypothetical protein